MCVCVSFVMSVVPMETMSISGSRKCTMNGRNGNTSVLEKAVANYDEVRRKLTQFRSSNRYVRIVQTVTLTIEKKQTM